MIRIRMMQNYISGQEIHQLLHKSNLENKVDFDKIQKWKSSEFFTNLALQYASFIRNLGINASMEEAEITATRVLKLFCHERFNGLDYNNFPSIATMNNEFAYDSPIIASNIAFQTTCEHHLVPINGTAVVAYIPKDKLIGLSKINELLYFFAARPQLQERLTLQIIKSLSHILQTEDIAVLINASHDCMNINGNTNNTTTHITSKFSGIFTEQIGLQTNLMQLINNIN